MVMYLSRIRLLILREITINFLPIFVSQIMSFCYLMIILKLRETKLKPERHGSSGATNSLATNSEPITTTTASNKKGNKRKKSAATSRANAERNRVTIMCAVLVALFLVCWLPFHAVHMAKIIGMNVGQKNVRCCYLYLKGCHNLFAAKIILNYLTTPLPIKMRIISRHSVNTVPIYIVP